MAESESNRKVAIGADEGRPGSISERVRDRKLVYIKRMEWVVALLLSATVLFFIIARTVNAGALWRDECDSLQLARMPTFADLLEHLHFTAFPILFPTTVRTYTTLFGTTDIALRCFGLAVGILFLGAAWFQSRILNCGAPLVLPALIGLNVNFLAAGLWLRGYGLGIVLLILAFALTGKFLLQPNARALMVVFLACLASMQCLFFNAVLVVAIVLAASAVLLIRRQWKWMWLLLGVAAVCGLTYLPYIWKIYSSTITWAVVVQTPFSWEWLMRGFLAACGERELVGAIISARDFEVTRELTFVLFCRAVLWRSIMLLCIIAGLWRLKIVWNTDRTRERDMLLFALLVVPMGILAHFGFLRLMQNIIMQRYHLAVISLVAAAASLIAANISSYYWIYFGRIALVLMAMTMLPFAPWGKLHERKSNIDIVAQRVEADARRSDLIVVNDAQLGISFNRYYHGAKRWITVPDIADHRIHRYDLMQKKMTEFFPLDDVKKDITATLKYGNRVWIVGIIGKPLERSETLLTPAPDPQFGWQLPFYINAWSRELGTFLRRHAGRVNPIVRKEKSVSDWEDSQLFVCEGW